MAVKYGDVQYMKKLSKIIENIRNLKYQESIEKYQEIIEISANYRKKMKISRNY